MKIDYSKSKEELIKKFSDLVDLSNKFEGTSIDYFLRPIIKELMYYLHNIVTHRDIIYLDALQKYHLGNKI